MAVGLDNTIRGTMATAIINAIDAGAGAGLLRIYDGVRPAKGGAATTLLAELTLTDPCATQSNGVITFNAITADSAANASGTATWARIVTSAGTFVLDCSVGTSGADINLTSTAIALNGTVEITSASITVGA